MDSNQYRLGEGIGWWPWFGRMWMFLIGGGLIELIIWGTITLSRMNRTVSDYSALDIAKDTTQEEK